MKQFRFLAMAVVGLISATSAWGNLVTLDWVSPGNNPVGYYYVSPYTAQIQGTGQTLTLYCIDFNHEVAPPLQWQANIQTFNQANVPNMQYGGLPNLGTTWTDYEAAAWLVTQMSQTPDKNQQAVYEYAAWAIFLDPSHAGNYNGSVAAAGGSSFQSAINTAYNDAFTAVNNGYTPTGLDIVTPDPAGSTSSTQEFLIFDVNHGLPSPTPEPSSLILLASVFAVGGFLMRRSYRAKATQV